MLDSLVVLALCVQCATSEHERIRVCIVRSQHAHCHVLCVSKSIHVAHLQVCLTAQQLPLARRLHSKSKSLLRLVQAEKCHGTSSSLLDVLLCLCNVLLHLLCGLLVLGRRRRIYPVENIQCLIRSSKRGVNSSHPEQDFGVLGVDLFGLLAILERQNILARGHESRRTVGKVGRGLPVGLNGCRIISSMWW